MIVNSTFGDVRPPIINMSKKLSAVVIELNALIDQAWGKEKFIGEKEGFSIKMDPALARNLEWIRDCYAVLYKNADESFDEHSI